MPYDRSFVSGQSHLDSDATIAHEGRPQGGRAPTRGAPTDCFVSAFGPGKGTHKGCPYRLFCLGVWAWEGRPQGAPLPIVFSRRFDLRRAPTRGAPTDCFVSAFGPGKGTHKGCPYRLFCLGVWAWEGHPQGVPLPIVLSRRLGLGRAPTRGAPTDCLLSAFGPGKGTHKGCPYRLSSLGVLTCEGHPQGAPLPDCLLSAFGPGKGTHKGRPYRLSSLGVWPWKGHPQGAPLPIVFSRRLGLGRAPTRGAPTDCFVSAFGPGKGTHKGCPYRLFCLGVWAWEGHPQGVPLPIVLSRRLGLGRAPTRGAPTDCLVSAFEPGKGTHKGCPYGLSCLGVWAWEGHPQGVPLPIVLSRRLGLGRAPTRGAPTDCFLSAFGPGKGTHKGCPYRLFCLGVWAWEGHPQGVPLPIVFSRRLGLGKAPTRGAPTDCFVSAFGPGKGTHKGCPYRLFSLGVWAWEGHPQGVPLPIVFSRRLGLERAHTRGAPTDCLLSAFGPAKGTHKGRPYPIQAASRGFF